MENMADITACAWIVWAIAGIVSGVVAALAVGGRRAVWIDMAVGLVSSLAGAVGCVYVIGLQYPEQVVLSTMCGVLLAGIVLWILDTVTGCAPDSAVCNGCDIDVNDAPDPQE